MGGRKGVEHESNEVSEQKEDEMLRKYLRMGSQLQRQPNSLKWGENDGLQAQRLSRCYSINMIMDQDAEEVEADTQQAPQTAETIEMECA